MHALIQGTRVCQLAREPFHVAPELSWVECDKSITTTHTYEGGKFIPPCPGPDYDRAGDGWVLNEKRATMSRIRELEASATPRRVREAIRGPGKAWLEALDDQIAAERAKL